MHNLTDNMEEHCRKCKLDMNLYHDMQSLYVGEASEEGRHHLDVIANSETDIREHASCARRYPWLEFTQFRKQDHTI